MIFQFFWDRKPLKTIHYAEPSPGFAATPKTFNTCPQDPARKRTWNPAGQNRPALTSPSNS